MKRNVVALLTVTLIGLCAAPGGAIHAADLKEEKKHESWIERLQRLIHYHPGWMEHVWQDYPEHHGQLVRIRGQEEREKEESLKFNPC